MIFRRFFTILVCVCAVFNGVAENRIIADTVPIKIDTCTVVLKETIVNDILPEDVDSSFIDKIDELHKRWYISCVDSVDYLDSEKISLIKRQVIRFPDSLIIKRLDTINSPIQLSFNKIVRNYIELYTIKRRSQVCNMLGLAEYYFPIFEKVLDANNMPLELKYLPVIESALNPLAFSRAGACGLWQFMYGTGKQYKLNITSYIDERRDPIKSTESAVKYLKDMYKVYGDWMLVIAAYNCGPGNVNRAIRRSGGKKNYWDIYYRLPKETRGYVPAFIAAMYTFNYSEAYNLYPIKSDFPPMCDTLMISQKLHFEQVASVINMPLEQLRDLNPQYRKDIIPANNSVQLSLRLPYNFVDDFVDMQDSVLAYNRTKYFDSKDRVVDPRARFQEFAHISPKGRTKIYYKVKSGDAVSIIAERFKVRAADLRYWNGIRRNIIKVGQKLVLYVPSRKAKYYANKYKNTRVGGVSSREVYSSKGDFVIYKVRRGENLWTIARKFPGVSNKDIMRWNNIRNAKRIKPGMKLKIKRLG